MSSLIYNTSQDFTGLYFFFDLQDKTSPPLGYLPAQAHGSESVSGMKSQHTVLQPPPLPDSPPGQQAEGSDSAGGMISRHAVTQPPTPIGSPPGRQAEGVGSGHDMTSQQTSTQPRAETEARNSQEVSTWM